MVTDLSMALPTWYQRVPQWKDVGFESNSGSDFAMPLTAACMLWYNYNNVKNNIFIEKRLEESTQNY